MEILKIKYSELRKAYKSLGLKVEKFKDFKNKYEESKSDVELLDDYLTQRDSLIQRFEYSYDLTWKFLKEFLRLKYMIEVASPKKTFDACLKERLINEQEAQQFVKMVETRNYASHIYSNEMAEEISFLIPDYYKLMIIVSERFNLFF